GGSLEVALVMRLGQDEKLAVDLIAQLRQRHAGEGRRQLEPVSPAIADLAGAGPQQLKHPDMRVLGGGMADIAFAEPRIQQGDVEDIQFGGDDLRQKMFKPLIDQQLLLIGIAVPANDLVRVPLAATAYLVADTGRADADAGSGHAVGKPVSHAFSRRARVSIRARADRQWSRKAFVRNRLRIAIA